jgi:ubiquitin thioesterase protein OTUB1
MNTSIAHAFRGLSVEEFYETIDSDAEISTLDLSTDLYIITFMRCLTSAYLQTHESDFSPFLADGTYSSIADFCRKEVDPMYRESDQLQIMALTLQVGVPVEVHYLDRSEGDSANVIRLPADDFGAPTNFQVSLVYKPGHYDILYT